MVHSSWNSGAHRLSSVGTVRGKSFHCSHSHGPEGRATGDVQGRQAHPRTLPRAAAPTPLPRDLEAETQVPASALPLTS